MRSEGDMAMGDAANRVLILNPTIQSRVQRIARAPRLESLEGITLGFMQNGKPKADIFLEELASVLSQRFGIRAVFAGKDDPSRMAPRVVFEDLKARSHGIVTGVGD